jgi:lipopolysaccharide transport system ATP-binding protein
MGTISISHLGKAYRKYPSRWSRFFEWFVPFSSARHTLHWVLSDVSFTVNPGEALGIIGINGAGKSTLLKMIVGTTAPTTGSVSMTGRVAAMLELGMGFHPDFTGRQNVVMAAQLLGINAQEIVSLMPEIEAFAEIGDYLDQPVRVYSSGMQVRLAFSVATAIRPDILIVDEALSVGDAYFQHKSFERIRQFRKQGTTLLIVTHDKAAIQSICDRAILLQGGRLAKEGDPESVLDLYNALLSSDQSQSIIQQESNGGKLQTVSGTGEAQVVDIGLFDNDGKRLDVVGVDQPVKLKVVVEVILPIERLVFGYAIKDRLGQVVFGTNTDLTNQVLSNVLKGEKITYSVDFNAVLGEGTYSVQTALVSTDTHLVNNYEWRDLAYIFNVINLNKTRFVGTAWIDTTISIAKP